MPVFTDIHALVKFLEKEATSIEPVKGIQKKEIPRLMAHTVWCGQIR